MTPMRLLSLYGLTTLTFFAIDLVWLGVVARGFYQDQLGHLMRATPVWPAALLFYGLYIGGILVFAVLPSLEAGSLARAIVLGGFLGLVAYATFDLTSLALVRDFPGTMVDKMSGYKNKNPNANATAFAATLKLHPFVARNTMGQLKNFNQPELEKAYAKLLDIDLDLKTSRIRVTTDNQDELALAIERFILNFCC